MTEGNILRHMINFALPLLLGNLFQQFYNMVDTWVVGNYVSNEAFSAVGTVGPITNMLIGSFMGLASGAGVVISQYYGAQQLDKVKQAVHTSVLMTLILGVAFTVFGIGVTPAMLRLMNTPESVFPEAKTYLTIYFAGIMGLMLYNMGAGILRAVGDSRRPFYFLVVSALTNVALDLLFVLGFSMGVEGVAYATIISQGVSAILVFFTIIRTPSCVQVTLRELRMNWGMLGKILRVGLPATLQMALTCFSNVFVQSYINYFGPDCMGGWTAYSKLDQLIFLPMQSLALASTTFVGQNLGKGRVERAKAGVRTALIMAISLTALVSGVMMLGAPVFVSFFNDKPEVVELGTMFLRYLTPFYFTCCFNQVYSAALRGAGNSRAPMLILLFSFVVFRQAYLYIMANFIANEILPIAIAYPAGWLVCSIINIIYYHRVPLDKNKLVEPSVQ